MSDDQAQRGMTSIIDNKADNTLLAAVRSIGSHGEELWIATAFFSLDALNLVGEALQRFARVRLLFGDEASKSQRSMLLKQVSRVSERDLLQRRTDEPLLEGLGHADRLIRDGRLEARCYVKEKFHAKAYVSHLSEPIAGYTAFGIVGSGNFTRPGLLANIELNVRLSHEQTSELVSWYQEMWDEAQEDVVTSELAREIERHLRLYAPRTIYLRALLEWGDHVQGRKPLKELRMLDVLDVHQIHAYRQALAIIEREPGVMICDGVGLGKSFVALALMEHWLSEGSRVLLIAPKAILTSSWLGYLDRYLEDYSLAYSNVHAKAMTWLGADLEKDPDFAKRLGEYAKQADVVVVDESHNFRNSAAKRYDNLLKVVEPNERGRKKIVLLTATPINTKYEDLANQFQLLTHVNGSISGIARLQLSKRARLRDRELAKGKQAGDQDVLFEFDDLLEEEILGAALESVAIQRSRKTCRELAEASGKQLRFPKRNKPIELRYTLGPGHEATVREASLRFKELGAYLAAYKAEVSKASDDDSTVRKNFAKPPQQGLKFSGYLPNLFAKEKPVTNRDAQVEAFLASMVFVNVMKQLESSTPAFQSIIESLGQGLALRLRHYVGEEPAVQAALARHQSWIRLPENPVPDDADLGTDPEDGAADEASGGETDDFVCREERRAVKRLKELGFGPATHDVKRWAEDILSDLEHLESIHNKCLGAQREPDAKLDTIAEVVRKERAMGRKVLVFSQSRKTADYIREGLEHRLGETVGLVNASVGGDTRARILNAFSPNYNDPPKGEPGRPIHILVSTDVLSEGVNLQEAGCIINYDLHWNPTRLIQRIGRVDRRLRDQDPDHSFDIYNVFPPPAINEIIQLVDTVERRTAAIRNMLGIDVSFFKTSDEEGTLREFNRLYEGEVSERDAQLVEYVRQIQLDSEERRLAESIPMGALGVWEGAPRDGVFALFRVAWRRPEDAPRDWQPEDTIPPSDLDKFASVVGSPRFLLLPRGGKAEPTLTDPAKILSILSQTVPGERSGRPSGEETLRKDLKALRRAALASIREKTQSVTVELVCWMELKSANGKAEARP